MFNDKQLLNKIFIDNEKSDEYFGFHHTDKTWIMPRKDLKPALEMYQPSGFKGKVAKKIILCSPISVLSKKFNISIFKCKINEDIYNIIKSCLGQGDMPYYIAAYMGDTSSWQNDKVTLQIYNDKKILGYVKLTENKQVYENFQHEIEALNFLKEKGIPNIPTVISNDKVDDMYLFMQSTRKSFNEKVHLKFGDKQIAFIKDLVDATTQDLDYEESDFYKYVNDLKDEIKDFNKEQRMIINKAIETVEEKLIEKPYRYSFFHGDYTPWNIYYKDKELYAFDYEYSEYAMPEYMDIFHYLTQLAMLGKRAQTGGVVHLYRKKYKLISKYVSEPDFIYLCYLIYIVSFYKKRTDENKRNLSGEYDIWLGVMEYLLSKV